MELMILKIKDIVIKFLPEIVSAVLFLLLIPLYSFVNFYQNDDWNRNSTVLRFLTGDFSLLQVTATTFYSQGILGFLWALVFGPTKIPFLTLLISVLNFYLFWKILQKLRFSNQFTRFLIALLLFTNPLHIYSSIGFMTENYVIFYLLLAIYYFYSYEDTKKNKYLYLSGIFGFLSFYSKQSALVFLVGVSTYYLFSKRFHELKITSLFTLFSLLTYYFLFPRTSEMRDKDFSFLNLNFDYLFSISYGILIYLFFFTLPLITYYIWNFFSERNYSKIFIAFLISGFVFYGASYLFKPGLVSWEEFPYFENTFERTGFLPRTVDGTKYQFKYNYDLYYYADLVSKLLISLVFSIFIVNLLNNIKNKSYHNLNYNNANLYIILVNLFLIFFVSIFFDRYILVFLPFFILLFLNYLHNSKYLYLTLIPFIIFQTFFSYLLANDFIYTHNYIWTKSIEIVRNYKVNENQVDASGAWNRMNKLQNPIYIFSYDSPKVNQNFRDNFYLIEKKQIEFKGNLFINSIIYLYKIK